MDVKVSGNFSKLRNRTQNIERDLKNLPREFLPIVRRETPIDTGRARQSTVIHDQNTIRSDYPYAGRLNRGWSRQAREGFVKPSLIWLYRRIRQIFRGR